MTTFLERIVVEVVIAVCVGAVLGLMSGQRSIAGETVCQNRRQACPDCRAAAMTEAAPNQGGAGSGD
jgi:hypothetical protein